MKKIISMVMIFSLVILRAACSKNEEKSNDAQSESSDSVIEQNHESPEDITGTYIYSIDGSTLSIQEERENIYHVELTLYRLTYIDDFAGEYKDGVLTVTGTDAAGYPITAEITFVAEEVTMTFTDSTWSYLENGMQFLFSRE